MDSTTIAAIATPVGSAGIGIIRISGPLAGSIAGRVFRKSLRGQDGPALHTASVFKTHTLYHGKIVDPDSGRLLDEVLLSFMRGPRSYTCEDIVEINSHSGVLILKNILELVIRQGAVLAEPGEFTRRAFTNGRIDLTQAEAVMDLISARTNKALAIAATHLQGQFKTRIESIRNALVEILAQIEAAIDFPEETGDLFDADQLADAISVNASDPITALIDQYHHAHVVRDGLTLAVVGRPNVGKSSLMNRLIQKERVIVSAVPGTTRDFVEETANIQGIPIIVADTAGLHDSEDPLEVMSMQKTREYIGGADLILFVVDVSCDVSAADHRIFDAIKDKPVVLVLNKCDLVDADSELKIPSAWRRLKAVSISALYNRGLKKLQDRIVSTSTGGAHLDVGNTIVPNLRHKISLEQALKVLDSAGSGLRTKIPIELVAIDIKDALAALGEIIGLSLHPDILEVIFNRFCIGK